MAVFMFMLLVMFGGIFVLGFIGEFFVYYLPDIVDFIRDTKRDFDRWRKKAE